MPQAENERAGTRAARRSSGESHKRPAVKTAAPARSSCKLDEFIPYKLAIVANRMSQSIDRLFETRLNIRMPEWRIMMALNACGGLMFSEVVHRTRMDKARVSRAQRRLVDLELVNSVNDPADGRKVILSLTPKGQKMCASVVPQVAERQAWYLAALDDHEHRQLHMILDKLMRRSQEI